MLQLELLGVSQSQEQPYPLVLLRHENRVLPLDCVCGRAWRHLSLFLTPGYDLRRQAWLTAQGAGWFRDGFGGRHLDRVPMTSMQRRLAMKVAKYSLLVVGLSSLACLNIGCMGRAISEGLGTVTGASGKVVLIDKTQQLQQYRGFVVDSVTVTPGLKVPPGLTRLINEDLGKVAAKKKLTATGKPCLVLSGEVTNYETADAVDTAIGPLEECIVRAKLTDADTKETLAVANLVARAKSTTAGGEENLSEAIGKALSKWLKASGIKTEEEKKDQ